MAHMVATIDVHKRMLAVVVGDAAELGEVKFERRKFGTRDGDLRILCGWCRELGVKEVVMESTAQYWKPVWRVLEEDGHFHLELAQAQSNQGPKGRKSDFKDAERLWRRYDADELRLSFVPDPEQRIWRTQSRTRMRLTQDRAKLQNQMEGLLEEMGIKLSSVVSDLLGVSSTRMLRAIAGGETQPEKLAEMADPNLHATKDELCDALRAVSRLDQRYRLVLKQFLDRVDLNERQSEELKEGLAKSMNPYGDQVERVAEIPGMGVDSAQQVIAEVGPLAEKFATDGDLSSWVGVIPGENESAEENHSDRSPKGNAAMRRILSEAANAAVKAKGTVFEARYKRMVWRDPKKPYKATWAVAHHLCRVIWKVLHDGVRYEERGNRRNPQADKRRAARLARELKGLGYVVRKAAAPEVRT
jgi:transposase